MLSKALPGAPEMCLGAFLGAPSDPIAGPYDPGNVSRARIPYFPFVKTPISPAAACHLRTTTQPPAPGPLYCLRHSLRPVSLTPPHTPRQGRRIREACGHFRRPQKPLSEHTEYPKSRSMGLFWNLNRAPVTTFAPVRTGKAQKCDPSEPARANRHSPCTPRAPILGPSP